MIIALFGQGFEPAFSSGIRNLFDLLHRHKADIYVYKPFYDFLQDAGCADKAITGIFTSGDDLPDSLDYLFSIGGDGTFLKSIRTLTSKPVPVVGINAGRLGFLSAVSLKGIEGAIENLFNNEYEIEERIVLHVNVGNEMFGNFNYALNEITVTKRDNSSMINIHTYVDEEYLTTYWADGLIISTPSGSTAYSLSVGGPILTPDSGNVIITPIAPHNLTMRPIVIPDHHTITLHVEGRGQQFLASLDSCSEAISFPGEVRIRKAYFCVKTVKFPGQGFFDTLRNKLMWGTDQRN